MSLAPLGIQKMPVWHVCNSMEAGAGIDGSPRQHQRHQGYGITVVLQSVAMHSER
jgi:hypothetical protein